MNPRTVQVESDRKRELCAVTLCKSRGYENSILRMNLRSKAPETESLIHIARSELEAMGKYARYALLHQDQRFKIAVREYQRPARDAVNQAETIFGKITKLRCSNKFKVSQNRYNGRR